MVADWCAVLRRRWVHAATRRPDHDDLGVIMYTGELIISIIALIFFAMIFIKD
ncbi:hypothetical protein PK7R_05 [Klebsiella phage P-K7R]|nr:hypothetical protein PK7R_05 [Klebsiella phage P-K7R]